MVVSLAKSNNNDKGFFLLVEGSAVDKAAHPNDAASHLREILEFDDTVGAMLEFARQDGETLVIATADHETGGLTLGRGNVLNPNATESTLQMESFAAEVRLR